MKGILFTLIVLLTLANCSNPKEFSIDFCTNLNPNVECEPSESIFNVGDRVYVLFECNQPFTEKSVTGNFYAIEQTNKIPLGSQDWTIKPGDSYAYDYVDFSEAGIFEFEFLNAEGEVLAKNKLEIK